MTVARRRRRALVLLMAALACGGLAASRVETRAGEVEAQVGSLVPVVVTRSDLSPGTRLRPAQLAIRQVPERFAPRDSVAVPQQLLGLRVGAGLPAGSYVTRGALQPEAAPEDAPGRPIRRGERSVEVAVAGGEALVDARPGTRVDVVVTTEPRGAGGGSGRTYLALQDVELLGTRAAGDGGGADGAAAHASTLASLRVSLRQAVYLTAAQSFAREVRLLARAPGDKREARPEAVGAGSL